MADEPAEKATPPSMPSRPVRSPDFVTRYSNNVQFELGSLDFKLVFGETRHNQPLTQHTAIIVTPAEARLIAYYLHANLAIYEIAIGKVGIPKDVMPPRPEAPTEEQEKANPLTRVVYERTLKLYEDFLANL